MVQVEFGEGRADHDDGFAERDDDEERRSARPCGRLRSSNPRRWTRRIPGIQNRTAGDTYSIASAMAHSTSRDWPSASPPAIQKMRRQRQPGGDPDGVHADPRARPRRRDPQENRLADLHRGVGDGEPQSAPVERRGDRRRQHEPAEHHREQQQPDRRLFRIEPVGDPGGEDPHPPHREKQQRDLQRTERGKMGEQRVRYLRDRKHEDEIEEQFRIGDAAVLVRHDRAKHRAV